MKKFLLVLVMSTFLMPSLSIAVESNKAPNPVTQFFKNHWGKLVAGTGIAGVWLAVIANICQEGNEELMIANHDVALSKRETVNALRSVAEQMDRRHKEVAEPLVALKVKYPTLELPSAWSVSMENIYKEDGELRKKFLAIGSDLSERETIINAYNDNVTYYRNRAFNWNIAMWVGVGIAAAAAVTGIGYGIHKAIEHYKAKKKQPLK